MQSVAAGDVILVPDGSYHIVSHYGDGNSVVRSDIRVQTGKLIDAVVTHRAAIITLKLVSQYGGEARANTQWSVLTPGGDVVKELIGAFPRVILAEGEYRAVARSDDREKPYERTFRWSPASTPKSKCWRARSRRLFRQRREPLLDRLDPALLIGGRAPGGIELAQDRESALEPRARLVADERELVERTAPDRSASADCRGRSPNSVRSPPGRRGTPAPPRPCA